MRPCIVKYNELYDAFEAFDEHGAIFGRRTFLFDLQRLIKYKEYVEVSLNSRCGKTILDKVEGQHI